MAKFGKVDENNIVLEYRDMNLKDIPKHKRHLWKKVVDKPPSYNPLIETLLGPNLSIKDTTIEFTYAILPKHNKELKKLIAEEAKRRIDLIVYDIESDELDIININNIKKNARLLRNMDPIPPDYTDDKYWI